MLDLIEQDQRIGDLYVEPVGICPFLEKLAAAVQAFRNLLNTWKGSDLDALEFGPDWARILSLSGSEDLTPHIVTELTNALIPRNDSRIQSVTGIYVEDNIDAEQRIYDAYAQINTIYNEEVTLVQRVAP